MKDFEATRTAITSRFVQAPLGGMDAAIGEALGMLSRFADIERAHVFLFDGDREIMNEIARWPRPERIPFNDPLRSIQRDSLPYFSQEIFSKRDVSFSDRDEMPRSAPADRAFVASQEVRSLLAIPLVATGEVIGCLTLTTLTRQRSWYEEETSTLHALADVFAAAVTRREAEREQQESIKFARLITSLVAEFMNLPAQSLDDGVGRALETIARFVDCDRCAIYILDEAQTAGNLYRGWWAQGAAPVVDDFQRIATTAESPYGQWIHSDRPHLILNAVAIREIRPDAARAIQETRLGTVANLPLEIAGRRIGWFGIGARVPRVNWNEAELRSLGVAANALANMFSRRQAEIERRRHQRFEDTLSELAADFIKCPLSQTRAGIEEIIDRFARFAGCERAAVMLIDSSEQSVSIYCEWVADGDPVLHRSFSMDMAPSFYEKLMTSRGPWFMQVDDLPDTDQNAAEAFEENRVHKLLNCPLADGERVFGFASIGYSKSRQRPVAGTEQVLAVAAGIIASALTRERLENQAMHQREALARALRLGSLGQLATGLAHELNQPLTAIANYSRACVRRLDGNDIDRAALAEILERVSDEAIRAGDIIHNLRKQVKAGPQPRSAASLREIIEGVCSLLVGSASDHGVGIITDFTSPLPLVEVEPTEIGQVVINVVQNAIESIAAANASLREVSISTRCRQAFVEVEIRDSGPGFSDGEKAFDQFYTTKPGGLGLGLSISRALIESNGGSMDMVSSAAGATVRFTLPVASRPAPGAAAEGGCQPDASTSD